MVTSVLTKFDEIYNARQELESKNLSFIDSNFKRFLRRVIRDREGGLGDYLKSWDVNYTYDFVNNEINFSDNILDLGCHKSELVPILHAAGYKNLHGIDLNENTKFSIDPHEFKFKKGDFYNMPIESESMSCVSAISVIEHGYDGAGLFREVSRVLKPGGYFIASYDYWPTKIDIMDKQHFGLSWIIFDTDEIKKMDDFAASNAMKKIKASQTFDLTKPVIRFDGFDYTFAVSIYQKQ
jgi:SAM-dependent methyltransferase